MKWIIKNKLAVVKLQQKVPGLWFLFVCHTCKLGGVPEVSIQLWKFQFVILGIVPETFDRNTRLFKKHPLVKILEWTNKNLFFWQKPDYMAFYANR